MEFKRQERYAQDHKIGKYHNHNKEHPLSARIICQTCGCSFMLLESNRVGEEGRKYWRCSSFRGHKGTEVKDRTFTPPPMALWSNDPDSKAARYRAKHRKLPVKRQMLCTDIQISSDAPERAFVKAYNQLLSHSTKYLASIRSIGAKTDDILMKYRADELSYLIETGQKIAEFDYIMSLKILDHIEATPDGKLSVIFLVGTKITC